MATDRRLRTDLLKKLGSVTPQRLSQLVAEVKRDHGPMSTEDGTYVLAHLRGLDLSRYSLDRETVDRIRGMVPRGQAAPRPAATPASAPTTGKPRTPAYRPVRVGANVPAVDLMLPKIVSEDADRMADLYPKMYLLENSIRNVIDRVMNANHGKDWWTTCVAKQVRDRVQGRKDKEAKAPWHGPRGAHDIYYSDFGDLKNVIIKNWEDDFVGIFPTQAWITQKLEELEPARNTLAHHSPVPANEQKRLEVYFDDWAALIALKRDEIP